MAPPLLWLGLAGLLLLPALLRVVSSAAPSDIAAQPIGTAGQALPWSELIHVNRRTALAWASGFVAGSAAAAAADEPTTTS